jgi:hypothetical protein
MGARHFDYDGDDWKNAILECPKCHWKGTIEEAGPNYYAEVMDCSCPRCNVLEAPMLAIVNYSLGPGIDQRPRILKKQQSDHEVLNREAGNSTMHNLKLHDGEFRYRSAEEGEPVEIRVYYDPASRKKVYGEVDPRGIWIGVHPIELHDGVISVRFCEGPVISGLKFFVAPGSDDDLMPFVAVAERLDPLVPEVARIWRSDNERAIQMIVAAIDEIRKND